MYSFTFDSILLRLLRILFFISSDKSLSNKVATIVFSVKNFPKWYLRQNLEYECTWYVVHCVKSVQIRSYFWSVFSCIYTEYRDLLRKSLYSLQNTGKYWPEITLYLDTFHAVVTNWKGSESATSFGTNAFTME